MRSICEPLHTPFKMYLLDEEDGMLKPLLLKVWRHSGYVDVIRPSTITDLKSMSGTRIVPLMFEKWRDIDIDSATEVAMAENVIQQLRAEGKEPWE